MISDTIVKSSNKIKNELTETKKTNFEKEQKTKKTENEAATKKEFEERMKEFDINQDKLEEQQITEFKLKATTEETLLQEEEATKLATFVKKI